MQSQTEAREEEVTLVSRVNSSPRALLALMGFRHLGFLLHALGGFVEPARTLDDADAEKALSPEVCCVPGPILSFVDQDGFTLSRKKGGSRTEHTWCP